MTTTPDPRTTPGAGGGPCGTPDCPPAPFHVHDNGRVCPHRKRESVRAAHEAALRWVATHR